jgi:hypothetical protein
MFLYAVDFGTETEPARVVYTPEGRVRVLQTPVGSWIAPGPGLSRSDAIAVASREMQQQFGVDTSQLSLENEGTLETQGRHGHALGWVQRLASGIEWHYKAEVYDRVTYLGRQVTLPLNAPEARRSSAPLMIGLLWFAGISVLFTARSLFREIDTHAILTFGTLSAFLVAGIALAWDMRDFEFLWWSAAGCVAIALWLLVVHHTTVFLARHSWAYLTATYVAMLRLQRPTTSTALAVARGSVCGLMLLGARALILSGAIATGLVSAEPKLSLPLASRVPMVSLLAISGLIALSMIYGMASTVSLAKRWSSSVVLFAFIGGATGVANASFSPDWIRLAVAFGLGVGFCWVLLAHDMLTALYAAFTFVLWSVGHPLLRMHENVGNGQYWLAFVLWALLFACSLLSALRPLWSRLRDRTVEVLP